MKKVIFLMVFIFLIFLLSQVSAICLQSADDYASEVLLNQPGIEFKLEHNRKWKKTCRPMIEAFFHAKYFLEMAVKYGKKYDEAPNVMDSGWAALLELYNIR